MRSQESRSKRRTLAVALATVAIAPTAAGCGDDDEDESRPPGPPPLATKSIGAYNFDNAGVARDADAARRATGRYLTESLARADGYVPQPEARPACSEPARGRGGIVYLNQGLVDDRLDVREPEALLYEPTPDGARRLVALQYRVGDGQSGRIFGRAVSQPLTMWVYRFNPDGLFSEGNPTSTCRPGPAPRVTAPRPKDGPPPAPAGGGPPGGGGGAPEGAPPPMG